MKLKPTNILGVNKKCANARGQKYNLNKVQKIFVILNCSENTLSLFKLGVYERTDFEA